MKNTLRYSLLAALLTFCMSVIILCASTGSEDIPLVTRHDDIELPLKESGKPDHTFVAPDAHPANLPGRNQTQRVSMPAVKSGGNSLCRLDQFFSRLAYLRFLAVKVAYVSHYSQREKEGYYIYALRKLLI